MITFPYPPTSREVAFGLHNQFIPYTPEASPDVLLALLGLALGVVAVAALLGCVPPRGARNIPVWRFLRRFIPGKLPRTRRRYQVWHIWTSPVTGQTVAFK